MPSRGVKDKQLMQFIRNMPCCIRQRETESEWLKMCCASGRKSHAHHLQLEEFRQGAWIRNDRNPETGKNQLLPLCSAHHTRLHQIGEKTFWRKYMIEPRCLVEYYDDKFKGEI